MLEVLADLILGEPIREEDADFEVAVRPGAISGVPAVEVRSGDIGLAGEEGLQRGDRIHTPIVTGNGEQGTGNKDEGNWQRSRADQPAFFNRSCRRSASAGSHRFWASICRCIPRVSRIS